jgi:hypothetical protein
MVGYSFKGNKKGAAFGLRLLYLPSTFRIANWAGQMGHEDKDYFVNRMNELWGTGRFWGLDKN